MSSDNVSYTESPVEDDNIDVDLNLMETRIHNNLAGIVAEELVYGGWRKTGSTQFDLLCCGEEIVNIMLKYASISLDPHNIVFEIPGLPKVKPGAVIDTLIQYYLNQTRELLADKYSVRHLADIIMEKGEYDKRRHWFNMSMAELTDEYFK